MKTINYACMGCGDAIGFFHASDGMRCTLCNQPCVQMPAIEDSMPTTEIEQIVALERMMTL